MKKLISMVEYIVEVDDATKWKPYSIFLQQKPTLGMFVPCDDLGNVLEIGKNTCQYDFEVEKEAEQRVIFDGLDIKFYNCKEFKYQSELIIIKIDKDTFLEYNCYHKNFTIYIYDERSRYITTIEDLVPYNLIMK